MGGFADQNPTCESDGRGGWIWNDTEELGEKASMNMYDLITKIGKPETAGTGMSVAVKLNENEPKEATVFISHSWAEKFAYFVFVLCYDLFSADLFARTDVDEQTPEELKEIKYHWQKMLGLGDILLSAETVLWICALGIDQNANIADAIGGGDIMQSPFAKV
eukprot:gnl/TRDRNA2_/TRDRNA2_90802_c0_seq1.p1 gnl/TRDRNA2_/TRDRNA2_90802_c0~~gnl/TRDRNA2_/TRDRNA2_90802_c0_seq1.p1  ORF type:complete len:163 (-),score=36.29 gnl/TRDRNA2_/TRDRNA2_90802_c0_seq1:675-1163(-)